MNGKRAEEIMQSYGVINVSYNGTPIWIDGIKGDQARVTLIGQNKSLEVPLSALTETSPT